MLSFDTKTCLGVDFSGRDVKIVELARSSRGYEVVQAARLEIGETAPEDARHRMAVALRQFLTDTGTHPASTFWSLPTDVCSVKFAQLPRAKPSDMARMARYEAESQIPIPLGELVWGYTAARPGKGEDLSPLVIAAARRSTVEDTAAVLETAGLSSNAAMVASLAEVWALEHEAVGDEPALVVSIGDTWTNLTTIKSGHVTSCRSVRLGVTELQKALACDLGLEDCRLTEISGGVNPTEGEAVCKWIENLAAEIRRSALFSSAGAGGRSIGTAILAGDGAAFQGLAQALARDTGLNVRTGDPWAGMALSDVAAHNKQYVSASFAVATGLAIAGLERGAIINLMPDDRAEEAVRRKREIVAIGAMGLVAILLAMMLMLGQSGVSAKAEQLDLLRMRREAEGAGISTAAKPEMKAATATMTKIVADLGKKNQSPLEALRLLSESLPKSCWLTEMRFDTGKALLLRGNALSNSAVADTVYLLTNSAWFDSVSLDYSNLGQTGATSVYDFQIKCILPGNSLAASGSGKKSAKKEAVVR